jgi:glycosyltransferase involved in cell wall biosynthesis
MRILHTVGQLGIGGTEKMACLDLRSLQQRGHDVLLVSEHGGPREDWARTLLQDQVRIDDIVSRISDFDPDIVHRHRGHILGFPILRHKDRRFAIAETSVFGHYDHTSDKTYFVSPWLAGHAIEGTPELLSDPSKIGILRNPVRARATWDLLPDHTVDSDQIIFGSMGRSDNYIFDDTHLVAMNKIEDLDFSYMRLGACEVEESWLEHNAEFPYETFPETCSDTEISKFLNTIDIYCHSRHDGETCGMVILEAMAHGKRVIAHRGGKFKAHIERLKPLEPMCRIVNRDPDEYAVALKMMANESPVQAEAILPGHVFLNHAPDLIAEQLERDYTAMIRERSE